MNKKGNMFTNVILLLMLAVIIGATGYFTDWFGIAEKPSTSGTNIVTDDKKGDQASLKYSVVTVEDTPQQFAGTGYCWDVSTPDQLIGSRSGQTLSGSTNTAFAPAIRDKTYECTAFGTTYFCDHDSEKMTNEALELRSKCYNLTSTGSSLDYVFYELGTAETTNSLTIQAGSSKSYGKWYLELNTSDVYYPFMAICLGSNVSDSHISDITVSGFTEDTDVPDWLSGNSDDYCFKLSAPDIFMNGDGKEYGAITIKADNTGFGNHELLNVTIHDACEYVARDGSVKKDYFQRDTTNQGDCGAPPILEKITLIT